MTRPAGSPLHAPRQILLFSGHMIDTPDRAVPRFPPRLEQPAARRIAAVLDQLSAGPEDLAYAQAAAGGDILFLEACRRRGVAHRILLPFPRGEFVRRSILPSAGGTSWRERFDALQADLPPDAIRLMPGELGPAPPEASPYERCNEWLLDSALAWGADRLRFICLWDGQGGDGRGGTAHMHAEVIRRGGKAWWIDTRTLETAS